MCSADDTAYNLLARIWRFLSKQKELLAYLLTGAWNTLFGIGLYSLVYSWVGENYHYLLIALPVNVLSITNAFVCYKLFVFKTKGNWLKEYIRCYLVYGGGMLLGFLLLWILKEKLCLYPPVANAIATLLVIMVSYVGHKFFSFRKNTKEWSNKTFDND